MSDEITQNTKPYVRDRAAAARQGHANYMEALRAKLARGETLAYYERQRLGLVDPAEHRRMQYQWRMRRVRGLTSQDPLSTERRREGGRKAHAAYLARLIAQRDAGTVPLMGYELSYIAAREKAACAACVARAVGVEELKLLHPCAHV